MRHPRLSAAHFTLLLALVCLWQGIEVLQDQLALSLNWALLDEVAHASVATLVLLWTVPAWGPRPALIAVIAATGIDVDHVVAARSFEPAQLMALSARPPAHSLLGVLAAANLGAALGGARWGFGAGVGALTHILRDATASPGVPLLFPTSANWHLQLPTWLLYAAIVVLAAVAAAWSANARPARSDGTSSPRPSPNSGRALRWRAAPSPDSRR